MKKAGLKGHVCDFSVSYDIVNVSNNGDVNKYLIKKNHGIL